MRPADLPPIERFQHGTRARYVCGCRCADCRAANTANARARAERARELATALPSAGVAGDPCPGVRGVACKSAARLRSNSVGGVCCACREHLAWNGTVDAKRARLHLQKLSARGIGRRSVNAACDVSMSVLADISTKRKSKIRQDTERRILSVDAGARADASTVPAGPTWRLVELLLERGFTRGEIASRLGNKRRALQLGHARVLARTAAAVARLYRTAEPPEDSKGLTSADLVPCSRCGLRGHVAGDAERCLAGSAAAGIGQSAWMGEGR